MLPLARSTGRGNKREPGEGNRGSKNVTQLSSPKRAPAIRFCGAFSVKLTAFPAQPGGVIERITFGAFPPVFCDLFRAKSRPDVACGMAASRRASDDQSPRRGGLAMKDRVLNG